MNLTPEATVALVALIFVLVVLVLWVWMCGHNKNDFDRGYAYAKNRLAAGASTDDVQRELDLHSWSPSDPFDRGMQQAINFHTPSSTPEEQD